MKIDRRLAAACAMVACAALLVAAAGLLLGRGIALSMARGALAEYGDRLMGEADAVLAESSRTLAAANESPHPLCSDRELVLLRDLAFNARYIKDVGRLSGENFVCSGSAGRVATPVPREEADFINSAGQRVYANATLVMVSGERGLVLEAGAASVVIRPNSFAGLAQPPFSYMFALVKADGQTIVRTWGESFPLGAARMTGGGNWRDGDLEYNGRCSPDWNLCAVAVFSRATVFDASVAMLAAFTAAGGVAGGLGGLSGLLLWRRSHSLAARLRRAVEGDALDVVYQPIVSLDDNRVTGAEALVRWSDGGKPVRPDIFVQIAEDHGFVDRITALVVRRVLAELGDLLRARADLRISVNVAASDLADSAFFDVLETATTNAGVERARISIELTERSSADRTVALGATARLRQGGHRVYIDDFGTGYSSLSYLHQLAIDVIKIDRAFTLTIGTEAVTASVVPQIIDMARTLNLGVVVEGIETDAQADYFRKAGWPVSGQGWLFGKPMPAAQFIALVQQG